MEGRGKGRGPQVTVEPCRAPQSLATPLQAILNKAKKWGFVSVSYNLRDIFEKQDLWLFKQIVANPQHCLNSIL